MKNYYAGIGSRETPFVIMRQMSQLAGYLGGRGWVLRSGGADGADTAFEAGVPVPYGDIHRRSGVQSTKKQIFLPWPEFNGNKSLLNRPSPPAVALAARTHPAWGALTTQARLLHARNSHQIFGKNMTTPVRCVICWTKDGKDSGGTAQAIRIARANDIPVFNMATYGLEYIRERVLELELTG